MGLNRKERDEIKLEIQNENVLLQRVKRYVQYGGAVTLFGVLILVLFFKNGWNAGKVIVLILTVIAGLFTVASFLSYRNGRKHLLERINYLDQNK